MSIAHLIKLMFCLKLLLILLVIFLLFKLIMLFIDWRKHKVLMLPKIIFVIICLIIGAKGYSIVHHIQSNAQTHETKLIKAKNATKRLYERKGSEAVAKKAGQKAKKSSKNLWDKSKNNYHKYQAKFLKKYNHSYNEPKSNSKQLQKKYNQDNYRIQELQKQQRK